MTPEHENELYALAPTFFRKDVPDCPFTEAGFQVQDGWYLLLREMALALTPVLEAMTPEERAKTYCQQTKQKFGDLRVYVSRQDPRVEAIIEEAAVKANVTCETCGKPGKKCTAKWGMVHIACSPHESGEDRTRR